METLHKLAGVQDAGDLQSSSNERPSQPQVLPTSAPPIPNTERDTQNDGPSLSQRASRASLPLNRQPSHKSFRSSKHNASRTHSPVRAPDDYPPTPSLPLSPTAKESGAASAPAPRASHDTNGGSEGTEGTEGTEDFAWGPNHPCFPHPNPHCAPNSSEYHTTRVIRVRRDWLQSGDLYPQYANLYPEILDPLVSDVDFRMLVSRLNSLLKEAYDPFTTRAWVDSLMGAATGYLWDDLGLAGTKGMEREVERFLEGWNEGREVRVVPLRRTGFMSLDFVVPDPGIDGGEGSEDEDGEEGGGIGSDVS